MSVSFPYQSTGQESTDCKNEEISLPKCDVDQERTVPATSDTCSIKAHPEYNILRNMFDDFSPPHSNRTVSNDSVKAKTHGKGRKRMRKRRSRIQNEVNTIVECHILKFVLQDSLLLDSLHLKDIINIFKVVFWFGM